ncbi:hypothetical protein ACNOYE_26980 [Nannocystaceae bacterium ST9]
MTKSAILLVVGLLVGCGYGHDDLGLADPSEDSTGDTLIPDVGEAETDGSEADEAGTEDSFVLDLPEAVPDDTDPNGEESGGDEEELASTRVVCSDIVPGTLAFTEFMAAPAPNQAGWVELALNDVRQNSHIVGLSLSYQPDDQSLLRFDIASLPMNRDRVVLGGGDFMASGSFPDEHVPLEGAPFDGAEYFGTIRLECGDRVLDRVGDFIRPGTAVGVDDPPRLDLSLHNDATLNWCRRIPTPGQPNGPCVTD